MTIRLRRYALCLAVGVFIASPGLVAGSGPQEVSANATLASFHRGVNDYMATRWQALRALPPLPSDAKYPEIRAALERQVSAVRRARAEVWAGNVFSPRVGELLRETIDFTLEEYDIDVRDLLAAIRAEVPSGVRQPRVNERFPWLRGAAMPMVVIVALPPLPYELQYRFVGRDLVLLDVSLGLVVDILPNALPKN